MQVNMNMQHVWQTYIQRIKMKNFSEMCAALIVVALMI